MSSSNDSFLNFTFVFVEHEDDLYPMDDLDDDRLDTTNLVVMAIVLAIIFVTSIAGNVSVFIIFYKRPSLVTISNRFIVNLSICNILETIFVMPFVFASLVTQDWVFGKFWCQATGLVVNATFAASILTLVIIAVDRYCAVVTPLHYSRRITSKRAMFLIAFIWILAILVSIPPLIGWNRYEFQRQKVACMTVSSSRESQDRLFTMFLVALCFILPSCIIFWAYSVIFKAARHSSEKVRRNSTIANAVNDLSDLPLRVGRRGSSAQILIHRLSISNRTNSLLWRRDEWKTAVTSFMVLFTFIVCWLLYFIVIILESVLDNPSIIDAPIKTMSVLLAMSSCAINPLVYVFRCKIQRIEFKSILGIKQTHKHLMCNGANSYVNNGSRRPSTNASVARGSPCITREGSQESDVIEILHHVNTTTTLTSMVVSDETATRT